jgi:two-component system, NtrC family, response regulator GlrR
MSEGGVQREEASFEGGTAIERPMGRRRSDRIVGGGRATQEIVDQAMAFARSDRPILIWGPSGAGKDHLARAIHAWSSRAAQPFIAVSCAAQNADLLARELFGCAEATYPQLPEEHVGALARAGGGALLVDGVDQAPEAVRETLTKAIADGRFQREGDGGATALRARVIATCTAAPSRPFFGDLAHHVLALPPLSARREDVLPLAAHFLRLYSDESGVTPIGFTPEARSALLTEPWSGNVRELAERVRQAIRLAGSGAISAEALLLAADGEEIPSFKEAKRAFETRYVVGLLRRCSGNISRAARLAKKDRKDFYDVIRRTGIDPSEFR